jgi:hypothetical protein
VYNDPDEVAYGRPRMAAERRDMPVPHVRGAHLRRPASGQAAPGTATVIDFYCCYADLLGAAQ